MTAAEPGSFRDRDSRVVISGDAIYRALSPEGAEDWKALSASPLLEKLTASGQVIGTREVDAAVAGIGQELLPTGVSRVLEHDRVPFVSYPYEWTFSMLQDAAKLQLELGAEAIEAGLALKDATPYNVQFIGSKPTFIDIGSFEKIPEGEPWIAYRQFCMLYLYPLLFQAHKDIPFHPWMRGSIDGIQPIDAIKVFSLRAEYRVLTSFGTLGYMLSFPTADSPYGEEEEELLEGQEETGIGHRVSIMPTVQLAAGPIIVRNLTEWHMSWFGSYDGPYVRERLYDQLQASDGDWLLVNTSVLAYTLWDPEGDGLAIIGPYYEHVVTGDSGTGRQRVGGVAAWIDGQTRGEIRRLRVYLQSGVNLDDRNRDGAFFVQGGAGFDFWLRAQ